MACTSPPRQRNAGPEQDALDGLPDAQVDVVALAPAQSTPHLELLDYRTPRGRAHPAMRPADIAATRLVLEVDEPPEGAVRLGDGRLAALLPDPDGHLLLVLHL